MEKKKRRGTQKWSLKEKVFSVLLTLICIFLLYNIWEIMKHYNQHLKEMDNAQQNHTIFNKK